jgi:hypothetical protein
MDVIGAPSDNVDVEERGQSSSHRPETDHGVQRDVMLVVLRQFSHPPLLQPGVQHSIASTRRRQQVSKLDATTASVNLVANASGSPMVGMVTSSSSMSPGSGLSQGLTGLWSAVMTRLTSKRLRNSLHGLHFRGYKEVMYVPPRRCSITPSYPGYNHCLRIQML